MSDKPSEDDFPEFIDKLDNMDTSKPLNDDLLESFDKNRTQLVNLTQILGSFYMDIQDLKAQEKDYAALVMEQSTRMVYSPADDGCKEIQVSFKVPKDAFNDKESVEDLKDAIPDYMGTLFVPKEILSDKALALTQRDAEETISAEDYKNPEEDNNEEE
mgnify:CR=1 FL=1